MKVDWAKPVILLLLAPITAMGLAARPTDPINVGFALAHAFALGFLIGTRFHQTMWNNMFKGEK